LGVLKEKKVSIEKEVNATKETISGDAIWDLVKKSEEIVVASGKKIIEFTQNDDRDEVLAKIAGRTGNLRAPALKIGGSFYIGFNEELYNERIGE
jgi:arsenate reductase-like glutaredoxin family protein